MLPQPTLLTELSDNREICRHVGRNLRVMREFPKKTVPTLRYPPCSVTRVFAHDCASSEHPPVTSHDSPPLKKVCGSPCRSVCSSSTMVLNREQRSNDCWLPAVTWSRQYPAITKPSNACSSSAPISSLP